MSTDAFPRELQGMIERELAGAYQTTHDVLLDAMPQLRARNKFDAQIRLGRAEIDRGEYVEYDIDACRRELAAFKARKQNDVTG